MSELLIILQIVKDAAAGIAAARELLTAIVALCKEGRVKEARAVAILYKREKAAHDAANEAARQASEHARKSAKGRAL